MPGRNCGSNAVKGLNIGIRVEIADTGDRLNFVNELSGGQMSGLVSCAIELQYDAPLSPELLGGGWEALPKSPLHGRGSLSIDETATTTRTATLAGTTPSLTYGAFLVPA